MRFALIDAEQALVEPVANVAEMCRTLGVSSSGYYAWRSRVSSQHQKDDDALAVKVLEVHAKSRHTYGRPRIHNKQRKQGVHVSGKRLTRVMNEQGVHGKVKKKFVVTTDSDHPLEVAPNVLDRDFTASGPNQRWQATSPTSSRRLQHVRRHRCRHQQCPRDRIRPSGLRRR